MKLIKQQIDYLALNIKHIDFTKLIEKDYNIFKKQKFDEYESTNPQGIDGLQFHFYKKFCQIWQHALHDQVRLKSQFFTENIYDFDWIEQFSNSLWINIEFDKKYLSRIDFCWDLAFNKKEDLDNFINKFINLKDIFIKKEKDNVSYINKKNDGNEIRIYDKKLWLVDMLKTQKWNNNYINYLKNNYEYLSNYKYVYRLELQKNRKSLKDIEMEFNEIIKSANYFLNKYLSYYKIDLDLDLEIYKGKKCLTLNENELENLNNKLQYFYNSFLSFSNFSENFKIDSLKSSEKGLNTYLKELKKMEQSIKREKMKIILSIIKLKKFEDTFYNYYNNNKEKDKKEIVYNYLDIKNDGFEIEDLNLEDDEFIKFINSKKFNI